MTDRFTYTDQRYFHVVVLGPKVSWGVQDDLWRALSGVREGRLPDVDESWGGIFHRTIWTSREFGMPETRNKAKQGRGFLYDMFAAEISRSDEKYVVLGIPYSEMESAVVPALKASGLLRSADFMAVDTARLVGAVRARSSKTRQLVVTRVTVRLDRHPEVTGFSLSGDNIVLSRFYETLLPEAQRQSDPGEDESSTSTGGSHETSAGLVYTHVATRVLADNGSASIHCDQFGNFKLWVQHRGKNISLLRHYLQALSGVDASTWTSSNPFKRGRGSDQA